MGTIKNSINIKTIIVATLLCPTPQLINKSDVPWSQKDWAAVARARYVCRVRYKGCLVRFIKKEVSTFHAICKKL